MVSAVTPYIPPTNCWCFSLTSLLARWGSEHHPDSDKCEGAFEKYVVGTTFIFIAEFLLLCGGITYAEMERKRVADSRSWVGGDSTASDAVPMNTRVSQPVVSQAES